MTIDRRFLHIIATPALHQLLDERFDAALHGFMDHVADVRVVVTNPGGVHGGPDKRCTATVRLSEGGMVVCHRDHECAAGAISACADSLKRALRRTLEKARGRMRRAA